MDMKIDAQRVKKLREERSWSQEHLASVAGLSLRTVQRIETEGKASPESKMAIASALDVDVATLNANQAGPAQPSPDAATHAPARPGRNDLVRQVAVYVLVCAMLVFLDVSRHGALTWAKWPLLGWGLALLVRWLMQRNATPAHHA